MNKERIVYLLDQYSAKCCTEAEEKELMAYFDAEREDEVFLGVMQEWLAERVPHHRMPLPAAEAVFRSIVESGGRKGGRVRVIRAWGWAAAAVVLFLGVGMYVWRSNKKNVPEAGQPGRVVDVPPGKAGAVLTLADGSRMVLDSAGDGIIVKQSGARVSVKNGSIAYDATGEEEGLPVYNTITTARGRQYSVKLPDGTKVWLNAASSLRYPTVFRGLVREVEMTGEAYFEAAENAHMPFRVKVDKKATVEVLGTHFNVNAYGNAQTIDATLLEGSIKVDGVLLRPGQQAKVAGGVRVVDDADIDRVMAWKNGLFEFDGASLEEVMAQVERWYDVDVVYENGVPDFQFGGEVSRDLNLAALLRTLGKAGVRYRMEGDRKLVIMK